MSYKIILHIFIIIYSLPAPATYSLTIIYFVSNEIALFNIFTNILKTSTSCLVVNLTGVVTFPVSRIYFFFLVMCSQYCVMLYHPCMLKFIMFDLSRKNKSFHFIVT